MINVTKSYLPPLDEYVGYLQKIWENNWLTNNGPLLKELEAKLKDYFGVKHLFLVSNGTVALQLAIKALELGGKVITTPYSYVATTTSLIWENCEPIFADIDPSTFCLDPKLTEAAITPDTSAILATHVYGIPCDVEAFEELAKKHQLKVIYDGAHCFGVEHQGRPLLNYGDISTISFHATKLFHTVEGGAVVTNDDAIAQKIDYYRSFGHKGDEYFTIGINAKNSEFHAAMGLCNLPRVEEFIQMRKKIFAWYDERLQNANLVFPKLPEGVKYNYAYYPVIFEDEATLDQVQQKLIEAGVKPRRYFYPSLNQLPYLKTKQDCPVSENYANQVLSLPLYIQLTESEVDHICSVLLNALQS